MSEKVVDTEAAIARPGARAVRFRRHLPIYGVLLICFSAFTIMSRSVRQHSSSAPLSQLRFGTFNIRFDGKSSEPVPIPPGLHAEVAEDEDLKTVGAGEWDWSKRRWKVADSVLWEGLDVVGFQEALTNQVEDLQVLLGDRFSWAGVGRDDGKKAGEYVPIFYRNDKLSLLSVQHFWLSETPEVPGSVSWDAGQTRMVTITRFRPLKPSSSPPTSSSFFTPLSVIRFITRGVWDSSLPHTEDDPNGDDLVVLNTHWDDRGIQSRTESAGVILKQLHKILDRLTSPSNPLVILLGDLNSPNWEEGYRRLTGDRYHSLSPAFYDSPKQSFLDARHTLHTARPYSKHSFGEPLLHSRFGDLNTFTGFTVPPQQGIIDVVLHLDNGVVAPKESSASGKWKWRCSRFGVIPNEFDDGVGGMRSSDHRLVVAAYEKL